MRELVLDVISAIVDDDTDVAFVRGLVTRRLATDQEDEIRLATVAVLRGLLRHGWIAMATFTTGRGYLPWSAQGDLAADRIDREWRDLRGSPSIADIGYVRLTPAGEVRFRVDLAEFEARGPAAEPPDQELPLRSWLDLAGRSVYRL